jgi:hypothetical protein
MTLEPKRRLKLAFALGALLACKQNGPVSEEAAIVSSPRAAEATLVGIDGGASAPKRPRYELRCDEVVTPPRPAHARVSASTPTLVACTVVTRTGSGKLRPVPASTFARALRWEIVPIGTVAVGAVIENPRTTPARRALQVAPRGAASGPTSDELYGAGSVAALIDFDASAIERKRLAETLIRLHATTGDGREIVVGGPLRQLRTGGERARVAPFPEFSAIRDAAGGYDGDCLSDGAIYGVAPSGRRGLSLDDQPTYCVYHPL